MHLGCQAEIAKSVRLLDSVVLPRHGNEVGLLRGCPAHCGHSSVTQGPVVVLGQGRIAARLMTLWSVMQHCCSLHQVAVVACGCLSACPGGRLWHTGLPGMQSDLYIRGCCTVPGRLASNQWNDPTLRAGHCSRMATELGRETVLGMYIWESKQPT